MTLAIALQAAVPLEIAHLRSLPPQAHAITARQWASAGAHMVACHGDDLQYGGRECASTFGALARGLAALAYAPGGVTFAGVHWCVDHDACQQAAKEAA